MKIRSRSLRIEVMALAVAAFAIPLIFAATASAFEDPPVKLGTESGNLQDSAQYLLENSPREISGIESTAQSEALYKTVTEPPPGANALIEEELESETPALLQKVGAWSWSKVPEVAVAAAGGWVGWEIGSLIYGTFFEESNEAEGASNAHLADKWWVVDPAYWLLSDSTGEVYAPGWGLQGANHWSPASGDITDNGACETELYGDGIRLFAPGWISGSGCGITRYRNYVLWKPFKVVRCGEEGVACPGIEPVPYEGAGQPPAPTPEALRESLKEALETSAYPALNRLYNFEQEPENYPDPRITEKKVDDRERRCDRGTPGFENPGGNESPEPFAKKEETAFSVTTRPEGYEALVYLRWGTTYWKPGREGFEGTPFLDDWGGWGWRHIIAKHGWSALDREETEVALDIGTPQPTAKEGKYLYEAPDVEPGSGGVECIRKVVVDFETGEEDPAPRGIVTSYNVVK